MDQPDYLIPFSERPGFTQSLKDWEYLEGQRFLKDQIEEVDWFESCLLRYPNKKTATCLLHMRIDLWFDEARNEKHDRRTQGIAHRHLCD